MNSKVEFLSQNGEILIGVVLGVGSIAPTIET